MESVRGADASQDRGAPFLSAIGCPWVNHLWADPRSPAGVQGAYMTYVVKVDDNYDYMSGAYQEGDYSTLKAAIEACKKIVDGSLENLYERDMSAEALYQRYTMFGDDPYILTDGPGGKLFSAWDYAKERSEVMCRGEKKRD